jgi:hypothetical protein
MTKDCYLNGKEILALVSKVDNWNHSDIHDRGITSLGRVSILSGSVPGLVGCVVKLSQVYVARNGVGRVPLAYEARVTGDGFLAGNTGIVTLRREGLALSLHEKYNEIYSAQSGLRVQSVRDFLKE